ncbi:hypothetical protein [uncultured Amnibacterium sp.]|uniref:hypothetical protein n=1 Tax=uncultured Amnibacterium sp. TaxID=1631851 RepID=UPI0035CC0683
MTEPSAPPPGFYSDETGRRRWWDGRDWFDGPESARRLSDDERRRILDRAVAKYVQHGYSIRSNDGRRAVVAKRQSVNVLLNLLLVLVTGGIWLIFLALRLLNWPTDRAVLTVDPTGELRGEFSS